MHPSAVQPNKQAETKKASTRAEKGVREEKEHLLCGGQSQTLRSTSIWGGEGVKGTICGDLEESRRAAAWRKTCGGLEEGLHRRRRTGFTGGIGPARCAASLSLSIGVWEWQGMVDWEPGGSDLSGCG